ncbi:MAG: hypothetical protein RIT81_41255 [Deltaproteobacteria bacterium]
MLSRALGIEQVVDRVGTWRLASTTKTSARGGAQVDLLFERRDGVINVCEMKFSKEPFVVTKAYARSLKEKLDLFERHTRTKHRIVLTLVCPSGLERNAWSEDLVERVLDASALLS